MKLPAVWLLLSLGIFCVALSACGQKGPLFLPSEQPEQGGKSEAPATVPAPADTPAPESAPKPADTP
ncbi:LPS translocon maturation chaperone LptM [Cellvibrio mixtus]|uniref:LPS translocon maturation chaperone LptM n=1 Tax=Cellvibrio mixtus TaxID=39650 RepID=UPI0005872821|nr:lipoprotein [Cellvibrio mixtus]